MTIRLSRRMRALTAGVVLVAAGTLAGCSAHPGQAGVSHYVGLDGQEKTATVSEKGLSEACEQVTAPGYTCADILQILLQAPAMEEIGAKYKVDVSDEDAKDLLTSTSPDTKSFNDEAYDLARVILISNKLNMLDDQAQQDIAMDVAGIQQTYSVQLSPRYSGARSWEISQTAETSVLPEDSQESGGDQGGSGTDQGATDDR